MKLTDKHIRQIAEELECGMICFFHKESGEIAYHPDPLSPYFDPEPWEEIMDKIEEDSDNYIRFDNMDSSRGFRVMEDFALSIDDEHFREVLLRCLSRSKPFRNFKYQIDSSDYRQDWFDFRTQAYVNWVKEQIPLEEEGDHE